MGGVPTFSTFCISMAFSQTLPFFFFVADACMILLQFGGILDWDFFFLIFCSVDVAERQLESVYHEGRGGSSGENSWQRPWLACLHSCFQPVSCYFVLPINLSSLVFSNRFMQLCASNVWAAFMAVCSQHTLSLCWRRSVEPLRFTALALPI